MPSSRSPYISPLEWLNTCKKPPFQYSLLLKEWENYPRNNQQGTRWSSEGKFEAELNLESGNRIRAILRRHSQMSVPSSCHSASMVHLWHPHARLSKYEQNMVAANTSFTKWRACNRQGTGSWCMCASKVHSPSNIFKQRSPWRISLCVLERGASAQWRPLERQRENKYWIVCTWDMEQKTGKV